MLKMTPKRLEKLSDFQQQFLAYLLPSVFTRLASITKNKKPQWSLLSTKRWKKSQFT